MKKTISIALWLVLLCALGALAFKLFEPVFTARVGWSPLPQGAGLTVETSEPKWAKQGALAGEALKAGQEKMSAPALSAALSVDGKLVWRGAVGMADVERGLKADFETRFRVGSSSKAVTAVGVGVLMDQGKLKLEQPIAGFPHGVTLGQVMSHRAGIRNYGLCWCFPVWEHLNRRPFQSTDEQFAVV